jgi:4-amino-4-deoxy-L-arabinose transferase-like glycosyltransferase
MMQAATYTWTKALAAFFVIVALALYLAALRKDDSPRMIGAFLALAAGLLTHYSAGPYVVILTLHYLVTAFRSRPAKFRELTLIAALCGLLLCTWFAWSIKVYGTHSTFASNTSLTSRQQYEGSYVEKVAGNLFDTVAPGIVRDASLVHLFDQPSFAGFLRDNIFIVYQTNLIFGMGVLGGPLVVWLLIGVVRGKDAERERGFWLMLIPCAVVLGIAVVGERDSSGVAHLTLLPLELLGLTWLAVNFQWRRWAAWLILLGALVDFPLGVFFQARVENLENGAGRQVYAGLSVAKGGFTTDVQGPEMLSRSSWQNWFHKHHYALSREWLDQVDHYHGPQPVAPSAAAKAHAALAGTVAEDQSLWQGWYSRHGGSVTYFGDLFGEGWGPCAVWLALWAGLLWTMWRRLPPAAAAVRVPVKTPRKPTRRKR